MLEADYVVLQGEDGKKGPWAYVYITDVNLPADQFGESVRMMEDHRGASGSVSEWSS